MLLGQSALRPTSRWDYSEENAICPKDVTRMRNGIGRMIAIALSFAVFCALLLPSCTDSPENQEKAAPSPGETSAPMRDAKDVTVPYPVNEHGNTYGSAADVPQDVTGSYEDMHALYPDLVSAVATNGDTGYVWKDEIDPPPPANPDEAVKMMEARKAKGKTIVTVYEQDGTTVVGELELG